MKRKSEVFNCFKEFKVTIKKQSGYNIITLRSNQGEEYTSNDFEAFYTQQCIRHQTTSSYTPQLNGVTERKNRTIFLYGEKYIKANKLPKQY